MLSRRLFFSRWSPVANKVEFQPWTALSQLEAKIKSAPDFAIIEDDGIITAIEVIDIGSTQTAANLRLLSLRGNDDRPFKWESTGSANPIALNPNEYLADVTHISIWP